MSLGTEPGEGIGIPIVVAQNPPIFSWSLSRVKYGAIVAVFLASVAAAACSSEGSGASRNKARSAAPSSSLTENEGDEEDTELPPPIGLPRGASVERSRAALRERPEVSGPSRCDAERRFCAHPTGAGSVPERALVEILAAANDAFDALLALGLPRPKCDGENGGDPRIDLYVDPTAPDARAFVDPGSTGPGFDRGSGFIVAPPFGVGCGSKSRLAAAVGKLILIGQDSALEPNALEMLGGYLGHLASPCSIAELEAIDTLQRAPERTPIGGLGEEEPASFLFPWFIEDRYGTGEPGKLAVALASISGQITPADRPLVDEPDMFDALRVTQHNNKTSLAETMLEFSIARAFLGSRSDELHMRDVAKYGDLARPRMEWSVKYASLPRTLAPLRPIEPLGATYVYVDLTGADASSEVTLAVDWEPPVGFAWAILKLAADGSEIGRKELIPLLGATHVEATVRDLGQAASLLIVGVHEGISRRDAPFDPGRVREPARSYTLVLAP